MSDNKKKNASEESVSDIVESLAQQAAAESSISADEAEAVKQLLEEGSEADTEETADEAVADEDNAEASAEVNDSGDDDDDDDEEDNDDEDEAPAPKSSFVIEKNEKGMPVAFIFRADTESPLTVKMSSIGSALSYFIAALFFLVTVILTVYYIVTGSKGEFHSDCTDTIIWANASYESGHVYDETFNYACFLPFGVNLIMQPFLGKFGLSLTTHYIGMVGYFILLTVFFFLMLREMHVDFRFNCIATALMLTMTLSSEKIREIFWGHTIYYSLGLLFIVIAMFMYFHMINLGFKRDKLKEKGKPYKSAAIRYWVTFAVLCVFIMFTATDGISGLSIFALPFIGAMFAEHFIDGKTELTSKKFLRTAGRAVVFFIMIVLGTKLNNYWIGEMTAGYQDANSVYSDMNTWTDHVHSMPFAWIKLLGVENMAGQKLSEGDGVTNLIYLFNALLLAVFPIIATCFYKKYGSTRRGRMVRIWVWIHWAVTAIILLGYICGVLSGADWRVIPAIGTAVMLTVVFLCWAISKKDVLSRIAVILAVPMIAVAFINLKTVKKMPKDSYKKNNLFGLAEFLEDEDLTYGYATFWNANAITVISGSDVKVRDVNVDDYGVSRRDYQSSKRWYENQPGQSEYFLLLTPYEYDTVLNHANHLISGANRELKPIVNNTEYHVLVFDYNIIQ